MSQNLIKTHPNAPYFEDYDSTKNYQRILFKPGYAVQARELNNLQAGLQNQIAAFGAAIFKEGAMVLGTAPEYISVLQFVKIVESVLNPSEIIGQTFRGTSAGDNDAANGNITGKILHFLPENSKDPATLYVRYTSSGIVSGETLLDGEILVLSNGLRLTTASGAVNTGISAGIFAPACVRFIKGNFVHIPEQFKVVSRYHNRGYRKIVYTISENIKTVSDDTTLLDNSTGSPNISAPGADRYHIDIQLKVDNYLDEDSLYPGVETVLLGTIEDGFFRLNKESVYSEIGSYIEKRTFEESGNYTLESFPIVFQEAFKNINDSDKDYHSGVYTAPQIINDVAGIINTEQAEDWGKSKLSLTIGEPGNVAYIDGKRIELTGRKRLLIDKARDTKVSSVFINESIGNYFLIEATGVSLPILANLINESLVNITDGASEVIGTCRIRNIRKLNNEFRLYVTDLKFNTLKGFSDISKIANYNVLSTDKTIKDNEFTGLVFKLPKRATKSVINLGFNQRRVEAIAYNSSTTYTLNPDGRTIIWSTVDDFLIQTATKLYTPTSVVNSGNTVIITIPSEINTNFVVLYNVRRDAQQLTRKTKTLRESKLFATVGVGNYILGDVDVVKIRNVYESPSPSTAPSTSGNNVTHKFNLDTGQRDNFYDYGRLVLKENETAPTGRLLVVYDYFEHTAGDYFTVDSYPEELYEVLQTFRSARYGRSISLRDLIDLRPSIKNITTTAKVADTPVIICQSENYLPRIDKIAIDRTGDFVLRKGVSAENPTPPQLDSSLLELYQINLNPFTFNNIDLSVDENYTKRYTMKDIHELDTRLRNVEIEVGLREPEINQPLNDVVGSTKFINAVVYNYKSPLSIADIKSLDHNIAYNPGTSELRPSFVTDRIPLAFNNAVKTNLKRTGNLVSLDYNSINDTSVSQPLATGTLDLANPITTSRWNGSLFIKPEVDNYTETVDIARISFLDQMTADDIEFYKQLIENDLEYDQIIWSDEDIWTFGVNQQLQIADIIDGATFGNTTINQFMAQYSRSIRIGFEVYGLKPNTKHELILNGISISNYGRPENDFMQYSDSLTFNGETSHPYGTADLVTDSNGKLIGSFIIPFNDELKFDAGELEIGLVNQNFTSTASITFASFGRMRTSNTKIGVFNSYIPVPVDPGVIPVIGNGGNPLSGVDVIENENESDDIPDNDGVALPDNPNTGEIIVNPIYNPIVDEQFKQN